MQQELLNKIEITLGENECLPCEGKLWLDEISEAMTGWTTGKTAGSDGLPQKLHAKLWDLFVDSRKALLVNPCRTEV